MNSNKKLYFKILKVCLYIILAVISFFMILPFMWMISISLRPTLGPIYQNFFALIPKNISMKPYIDVWLRVNFVRYFLNSVIYAGVSTILTIFFSTLGGYTFAQLRFPGRKILFLLILFSMMIPPSTILIPQFLIVKFFPLAGGNNLLGQGGSGFVNTYAGLILPFLVTGFGIFLCRQFFLTLPADLRHSAKIDGCSEFRIFWQIMLPLAKPAVIALTIFTFTWRWNKLLWPLVVAQNEKMRVLAVALAVFRGERLAVDQWNEMMAAATIAILPVALVFFLLQKHFTKGTALTGIKG